MTLPSVSPRKLWCAAALMAISQAGIVACGQAVAPSQSNPPEVPLAASSVSVSVSTPSLTLTVGGPPQTISVNATAQLGSRGNLIVYISGLPTGVTATPSQIIMEPGGLPRQVSFAAAANTAPGTLNITFTVQSGRSSSKTTLGLIVLSKSAPGIDVTTYHYDNARDGLNSHETILTPANVNSAGFGLLRLLATDGKVDGAPLYLSAVTIGGAVRNVLYAVSEHDSVFAYDADTGKQLWKTSTLGANEINQRHS